MCAIISVTTAVAMMIPRYVSLPYTPAAIPSVTGRLVDRTLPAFTEAEVLGLHVFAFAGTGDATHDQIETNAFDSGDPVHAEGPALVGMIGGPPWGLVLEKLPDGTGGIVLFEDAPQSDARVLAWAADSVVIQIHGNTYTLQARATEWRR